jgi:hypothetical protein
MEWQLLASGIGMIQVAAAALGVNAVSDPSRP